MDGDQRHLHGVANSSAYKRVAALVVMGGGGWHVQGTESTVPVDRARFSSMESLVSVGDSGCWETGREDSPGPGA